MKDEPQDSEIGVNRQQPRPLYANSTALCPPNSRWGGWPPQQPLGGLTLSQQDTEKAEHQL